MADPVKHIDAPELSGLKKLEGAPSGGMFDPAAIQAKIDERIAADLGPDDHGAIIAYADTSGNGRLSVVIKNDDGSFEFAGGLSHGPGSGWGGDVEIVKKF